MNTVHTLHRESVKLSFFDITANLIREVYVLGKLSSSQRQIQIFPDLRFLLKA